MKCTDPYELKGEVVLVNIRTQTSKEQEIENNGLPMKNKAETTTEEDSENSSYWQRNSFIRDMIMKRNSDKVEYKIVHDDPASDDILDNINHNGSALLIEVFTALLRCSSTKKAIGVASSLKTG